ncbi:Cupin domain protein [Saccharopolyspora kobensis]|uniref:Cupin domain protein n=1 Tax=Saccharopolyspora kobensis TaxID=146035 RepID=A0A1H5VE62_9PSEU|nr:cupin domain-containing protein [Saccharopolyspora kobensis]SEF85652.1 Cupin domain protein [Saccharopolyspora kobensis]SFC61646.1 Cupin domain protein [Saccharopolyspora kobensis]
MSQQHDVSPEQPAIVPAGEGETIWFDGNVYTVKISGKATNGALSVLESSILPGCGPPPHVHTESDEVFHVLSGQLEFQVGDSRFTGKAGDYVFVPHGTPHCFKNVGVHVAHTIFAYTPAGFEEFFLASGQPAVPSTPVPQWGPEEFAKAVAIAPRFGWEGPSTK